MNKNKYKIIKTNSIALYECTQALQQQQQICMNKINKYKNLNINSTKSTS